MKRIIIFSLLLSFFFCSSQTFNDLVSLQDKDDIPNDIFDLFIRKGYKHQLTKENVLDNDEDCSIYLLFKEGTTIQILHCFGFDLPNPASVEENEIVKFVVNINSTSPKLYDDFLQIAKEKGEFFRKSNPVKGYKGRNVYYYKISPKIYISFSKALDKNNKLRYYVEFFII